jgi:RNA polymerase sigma-70 factor (ECF subfamily)
MSTEQEKKFIEAINQNIGIVHRVCNSYFWQEREERQDLFQEIMYHLWKAYPYFRGEAKFSTWMYQVALNTAITYRKKRSRNPVNERLAEQYNQFYECQEQAAAEERIALLYKAIHTLTDVDKAIILLHLEEHNYQDIAAITGLTKTNVSVRLVRIKKALEARLKHTI